MAYNTPDDCPWSSDADYYESRLFLLDKDDDEPDREKLRLEREAEENFRYYNAKAGECDGCGLECETIHGDENHSVCCNCAYKDAPASYRKDLCGICDKRNT